MAQVEIRVEGLRELRRALNQAGDIEDSTALRLGLKSAAEVVARDARGRVPSRTGRARDSIRATSGGNRAYVVGGKARVPYYGWLDFGSRRPVAGRSRHVGPWKGSGVGPQKGRFIYPALDSTESEVVRIIATSVDQALRALGF